LRDDTIGQLDEIADDLAGNWHLKVWPRFHSKQAASSPAATAHGVDVHALI
jgi:hypothetical protein